MLIDASTAMLGLDQDDMTSWVNCVSICNACLDMTCKASNKTPCIIVFFNFFKYPHEVKFPGVKTKIKNKLEWLRVCIEQVIITYNHIIIIYIIIIKYAVNKHQSKIWVKLTFNLTCVYFYYNTSQIHKVPTYESQVLVMISF